MQKLSPQEIDHIAKLSRLELTATEKEVYGNQLSGVLEYVSQLNEVATDNVEPTANITGLSNVWREDQVEASGFSYDDLVLNAPKFEDGSFVVPGVFD